MLRRSRVAILMGQHPCLGRSVLLVAIGLKKEISYGSMEKYERTVQHQAFNAVEQPTERQRDNRLVPVICVCP